MSTLPLAECKKLRARYEAGATYDDFWIDHSTLREAIIAAGGKPRRQGRPSIIGEVDLKLARRLSRKVTAGSMTVTEFSERMKCSMPTGRKLILFCGGKTPRGGC